MPAKSLLIPVKKCVARSGRFRWPARSVLATARVADVVPLGQLAEDLKKHAGSKACLEGNALGPAAVRVRRDAAIKGAEQYRLVVGADGVTISASTDAGAYYGLQTLRELVRIHGRSLPACVIDDQPDFARRGVYQDCSRGKVPTLETLKALVERLGAWKINELQLYVENVFSYKRHPDIGKGYSPLTSEEILALQEHCKEHHIRLVGSLASFGHLEKVLCLPQYRNLAEIAEGKGPQGGSTLCPTDPRSVKLVGEWYEEFVPLFEAVDFNVCCDETSPLDVGRSKAKAAKVGGGRLYLDFLLKIRQLCHKHGKRMNAWSDIILQHKELLKDVPRDIVMLNWAYEPNHWRMGRTNEIARAGLPLVVCPGTSSWATHGSRLGVAIANVANFAAQGRRWGAEGMLNTDWGDGGHRNFMGVSLHSFAHGAAHSWHGRGVDDKSFTDAFCFHVFGQNNSRLAGSLRALGGTYCVCSDNYVNSCALYTSLVEPLVLPEGGKGRIDETKPAGLRQIIRQLSDEKIWPLPPKDMGGFEALALMEFSVAARMDVLACRRALAAKDLRAGKAVAAKEFQALAADMHELAGDFKGLWLARNKPSRLKDNLDLMSRAETESRRLATAK
ncbi:MAG: glycoside hydrolase family 20 zincin-like fold domain-containing protein [Phycisphaerae bacterium]|jgi:hypothetical protein